MRHDAISMLTFSKHLPKTVATCTYTVVANVVETHQRLVVFNMPKIWRVANRTRIVINRIGWHKIATDYLMK